MLSKFAGIEPLLRGMRRRTKKPTTVDLHEVFGAMLYLLRTGCQWRFLPAEFPKWSQFDPDAVSVLVRA